MVLRRADERSGGKEVPMTDRVFYDMTADILSHPRFLELRAYPHHGAGNSAYDHSLHTARCAFRLARRFHMRPDRIEAVTRAALLHDFFGYVRCGALHRRFLEQYSGWQRFKHWHPFIHGAHAANRAGRFFALDQRQKDAIVSHMFPMAPFPKNSEAWVVTLADKLVASREVARAVAVSLCRRRGQYLCKIK